MKTTKIQILQREQKSLLVRFEKWRETSGGTCRRLPDELWNEAVTAAKQYGVCAVADFLKLDYYSLKAKLTSGIPTKPMPKANFIAVLRPELPLSMGADIRNSIDITKKNGNRLHIEFAGSMSPELSKLTERLWRASK